MGIIDTVRTIKKVQQGNIVMFKIGKFVYCYGKDAYIMAYIFKYRIKLLEQNVYVCGFPNDKINKIMAKLENSKVNYLVLDRKNNYRVDEESNNKNLNKYDKYLKKAVDYVKRKNQIDKIHDILLKNVENDEIDEIIKAIKKVINERGKI